MTHGTTEVIIHGILIMPDGTEGSVLIGDMDTDTVRAMDMADISRQTDGMVLVMRPRMTKGYSPAAAGLQSDEASAQAAAQVAESSEALRREAA